MGILPQHLGGIDLARFFVQPEQIQGDIAIITGPDVKHISRVLRMEVGDGLDILDGSGMVYQAKICEINKQEIHCEILGREQADTEPRLKVTLVQGLPKGDKLETIIQKCTELGIHRIIPLAATRSVVKLDSKKAAERQERWQRVAMEAAKQCRRAGVPEVRNLTAWDELWQQIPQDAPVLLAWEEEKKQSIKKLLQGLPTPSQIYILIGPEGGFDPTEVDKAMANGAQPVTLGSRILRTETAGPSVLTMVLYQYGELG